MKVIITAGGGGHFAAALAVLSKIPKEWEVLVTLRKHAFEADKTLSFEYKTSEAMHIPFIAIDAGRLQRKWSRHTIMALFRFPKGFLQAYAILKKEKPRLVISFGGYVSLPVVLSAALFRVPIVIHEQTLQAGLANRIASRFAKKVCISWDSSAKYLPKEKTVLTGIPLRLDLIQKKHFFDTHALEESTLPLVYVTGGSLGSHTVNMLIKGCIERLLQKYTVVHQTGDAQQYKDFEMLMDIKKTLPEKLQKRYIITKFVEPEEIASLLKKATLVISRAGMSTVSELLYFGKPTLFIPLPFSQNNEQMENALFFKKQGLGEVFPQENLTSERLYEHIVSMVTHKDRYEAKANAAKALIKKDAAVNILAVCQKEVE